jgi:hypothetical protein
VNHGLDGIKAPNNRLNGVKKKTLYRTHYFSLSYVGQSRLGKHKMTLLWQRMGGWRLIATVHIICVSPIVLEIHNPPVWKFSSLITVPVPIGPCGAHFSGKFRFVLPQCSQKNRRNYQANPI